MHEVHKKIIFALILNNMAIYNKTVIANSNDTHKNTSPIKTIRL